MRTAPNPKIIAWAIERTGKTPDDFTSISRRIEQWISGDVKPTVKQMEKFATRTHVPLPYFYDDNVPNMTLQIPDYRTTYSGSARVPSPELYETINLMQSRQDWLSAYLEETEAQKLSFIGSCASISDSKEVAAILTDILSLEDGWARHFSASDAVRHLRSAIESVGVYTCAGGYFHHSSRPYDVNEFRGFVLVNEYAPIIFVNTRDAKSAQLFTLVHEFAHLLFNETGVDDQVYEIPEKEDLCDSVAAEVLVPASIVFSSFNQRRPERAIEVLKRVTKASEIVCLRRSLELGCITKETFFSLYDSYKRQLSEVMGEPGVGGSSGGPSYYVVKKSMLGSLFADTVYEGVRSECLTYSDAYLLTDMKASSFEKFYAEEGRDL